MMFDPTCKEYQITEEFKPDKESTWPFPKAEDGWVHAHNSLRGEISGFLAAIRALEKRGNTLQLWEMEVIRRATAAHFAHIHAHHDNEELLFFPELKKRFHIADRLSADHKELEKKLETLEGMISKLKEGDGIGELVKEWAEYEQLMLPHLKEEEDTTLPLMRAYFTPKEIAPIIQKLIGNSPKVEMGSFIHFMDPTMFRKVFMKQEGIPSFVWYIDFNAKYKYFVKEFVNNVDALKEGKKPVIQSGWFSIFKLF